MVFDLARRRPPTRRAESFGIRVWFLILRAAARQPGAIPNRRRSKHEIRAGAGQESGLGIVKEQCVDIAGRYRGHDKTTKSPERTGCQGECR
jgi:hypothetical protein